MNLIIREALLNDIGEIQLVRNSVKENVLSNPALVLNKDVEDYLLNRGKGWVGLVENKIVGFSIVSVTDKNVWALFLRPEYEHKGIGKQLHDIMMNWYFTQTDSDIWLSTSPHTRAEQFYRKAGWKHVGMHRKELKFEMSKEFWANSIR